MRSPTQSRLSPSRPNMDCCVNAAACALPLGQRRDEPGVKCPSSRPLEEFVGCDGLLFGTLHSSHAQVETMRSWVDGDDVRPLAARLRGRQSPRIVICV